MTDPAGDDPNSRVQSDRAEGAISHDGIADLKDKRRDSFRQYLFRYIRYVIGQAIKPIGPSTLAQLLARAQKRALEHELHILLLWISRATAGWQLHRAMENFYAAIEERYSSDKESFSTRLLNGLPKQETREIVSALINRMVFRGITKTILSILTWSVPIVLLWLEVSDLRQHNLILEKQVNSQVEIGMEARDVQYLRILSCSPSCEISTVREHALRVYVEDQRARAGSEKISLTDINLSNATIFNVDLTNVAFYKATFDNANFNFVNFEDSTFDYTSSLQNTKFDFSNFRNTDFNQARVDGIQFQSSCLHSATMLGNIGSKQPLSYNYFHGSDLTDFHSYDSFIAGLQEYQNKEAASYSHAPPQSSMNYVCRKKYPKSQ